MGLTRAGEAEEFDDPHPSRRPPGGTPVTVLLVLLALGFLGWACHPILDLDTYRFGAALVALTQYAMATGVMIATGALLLRRWLTTAAVVVITVALGTSVVPRAVPDPDVPAPAQGTPLRVLSINTHYGDANAERIVDLVRANRVDVLSLQELTPEMAVALDRAGLNRQLPHRVFEAVPGAAGSGLAARHPLRELSLVPPSTMHQPSAHVGVPGGGDVEVVAAHPIIPVGADTTDEWRREIGDLPAPARDGDTPRVIAGDFNATLDHTPMRRMLGQGYLDAAEVTGGGLAPTWPMRRWWRSPPVTIDHVLISGEIVARDYRTFDVAGTDHRAVLAHLVVP
ncbi:endonuclease/exonuclease/phosphatase family protein [Parasphingorhabdus pacifica]